MRGLKENTSASSSLIIASGFAISCADHPCDFTRKWGESLSLPTLLDGWDQE